MNGEYWNWMIVILMSLLALILVLWPFRNQEKSWLGIPFVLIMVGLSYWQWGSWSALRTHQQRQIQQHKAQALLRTIKSPEVLIHRLQIHLTKYPKAARGWYFLGRLYASQHQWHEALDAFAKAYDLKPEDELIAVNYAQGLFNSNDKADHNKAQDILKNVVQRHPHQADALAMLAMDAQSQGEWTVALDYWQQLLPILSPQSEEAKEVRKNILQLRAKVKAK